MPIPSFSDTLGGTLGLGITIIRDGNVFTEDNSKNESGLSLEKMNEELSKAGEGDDIFFLPSEPPKEDIPFSRFLKSREKTGAL